LADLPDLQAAMLAALTSLDPPDELPFVAGDAKLDAAGRLGIYRDMYFARMTEVMTATFPKVAERLGHDDFDNMVAAFIDEYPSHHPSLRWVGRELAQFLEGHEQPEWLVDLARLEWARGDVFDAPDEPVRRIADLQALAPEAFAALPITPIGAHRRIAARTAVDVVWRGGDPVDGARMVIVWRQGIDVYHRVLDEREARFFPEAPIPFGLLCERIAGEVGDEAAAEIAFQLLGRWVKDELIRSEAT